MSSRENNWRSIVIQADPDWPRSSQIVPEYPMTGPGPRDPKGYRDNTIDGPNTFLGRTEERGAYASDWFTAAESLTFDSAPDLSPDFDDYDGALVIDASALTNSTDATMMRFTLRGSPNGPGMLEEVWVGPGADSGGILVDSTSVTIDFSSTPHRVTHNGQTRIPLPLSGTVVSDPLDFKLESGKNLVVRFSSMVGHPGYIGGTATPPSGWTGSYRFRTGGPSEAGSITVTVTTAGYGWYRDGDVDLVSKVEILE